MKRLNALKKFGKQSAATVTVAVLSVPAMAAEGGA
ncbi:putative secreted protein, partial [Vibrio parahaemolyticus]